MWPTKLPQSHRLALCCSDIINEMWIGKHLCHITCIQEKRRGFNNRHSTWQGWAKVALFRRILATRHIHSIWNLNWEILLPHRTDVRKITWVQEHPHHMGGVWWNAPSLKKYFHFVVAVWQMQRMQRSILPTWQECMKNNMALAARVGRFSDGLTKKRCFSNISGTWQPTGKCNVDQQTYMRYGTDSKKTTLFRQHAGRMGAVWWRKHHYSSILGISEPHGKWCVDDETSLPCVGGVEKPVFFPCVCKS